MAAAARAAVAVTACRGPAAAWRRCALLRPPTRRGRAGLAAAADASAAPPPIDAAGRAKAEAYLDAVLAANAHLNLTAVRDRTAALGRHIDDSLDFLPPLDALAAARGGGSTSSGSNGGDSPPPLSVIDVGAGAGYPGSVLAAARPAWNVTLLDALRKRTDFAARAAAAAGLTNAAPVWARAEEAGAAGGGGAHREAHDAAVARAVAETRVLAELCLPLVRSGGLWLAAKGPDPAGEVAAAGPAIAALGGEVEGLIALPPLSPGGPGRSLLIVRKVAPTPDKYPRRAGVPAKRPL